MMITSAVCWGSWANTYKGVKNYRFELFYWDYAIGIFVAAPILGLTMGSTRPDASALLRNIHSADTSNVINALIGGALFNLANLLLVAAIDMAGLAIAFPISIGIALGRRGIELCRHGLPKTLRQRGGIRRHMLPCMWFPSETTK